MAESRHSHDQARAADTREGVTATTSDGTITERPLENGPYDEFYLSPEDRISYGIRPDEVPYWARDFWYWGPKGELADRARQLEGPRHRGGYEGRVVRTKEYDKIGIGGGTEGDLLLMALKKDIWDARQKEIDRSRGDYESQLQQTEEGFVGREESYPYDPKNARELDLRMRSESRFNHDSGLIGGNSPTAGMDLARAMQVMRGREGEVAAKQEMLRMGGQHTTMSQEAFTSLMTGNQKAQRGEARGRSTHAMGNSGFARNQNSPLAQAQRRNTGGS